MSCHVCFSNGNYFAGSKCETPKSTTSGQSPAPTPVIAKTEAIQPIQHDPEVEKELLRVLCDLGEDTCQSSQLCEKTSQVLGRIASLALVENLLHKFAAQHMIV